MRANRWKCLLANCQSICNKLHDLKLLLDSAEFDVICFTETWLNSSITNELLLTGSPYSVFRFDRKSLGGGCCIFLKHGIAFNVVSVDSIYGSVELVALDLISEQDTNRIVCVYRPPSAALEDTMHMISCLETLCTVPFPTFLVGDFNVPGIDWTTQYSGKPVESCFLDFVKACGLYQGVDAPTRGAHILDLVLYSEPSTVEFLGVHPGFSSSDHFSLHFNILLSDALSKPSKRVRNFRNADYNSIFQYLSSIIWPTEFNNCARINDFWKCFSNHLNFAIERFVPLFKPKHKRFRLPPHLNKLNSRKIQLWKLLKNSRSASLQVQETARHDYRLASISYSKAVKKFHANRELRVCLANNSRAFFGYVNSRLRSRSAISALRSPTDVLTTDDTAKAEMFCSFFSSVFTKDNGLLPIFPVRSQDLPTLSNVSFTPSSVENALHSLSSTLSAGPDGFPALFLKNLAPVLGPPLAIIFEVSFRLGELPDQWRSANVIPIFKKGCASDVSNYRPISLTCVCCRVMERIIKDRMLTFLLSAKLISPHQHGFLSRRSTCSQLLDCVNDWSIALSSGSPVDVVYIDFSKAFDSVCHAKLIHKLRGYGIDGYLILWLQAFLSNRTQQVCVGDSFSASVAVSSGVPQGSVLGPLMFLLYINDLPDKIPESIKIKLFADDVKIYSELSRPFSPGGLQSCLNLLQEWCFLWQMSINADKCATLYMGFNNPHFPYRVDTSVIPCPTAVKDLGVHISPDLKFSFHCNEIVSKALRCVSLIFRSFISKHPTLLVRAYLVYIRPLLEYATPVFNPFYLKDIRLIESVQRSFSRRIPGLGNLPYSERLKRLNLDMLQLRRLRADLILCYQIIHGLVDLPFDSYFKYAPHGPTRGHQWKLYLPLARLDLRKSTFAVRVVPVWNSLSESVVSAPSLHIFRHRLLNTDLSPFLEQI